MAHDDIEGMPTSTSGYFATYAAIAALIVFTIGTSFYVKHGDGKGNELPAPAAEAGAKHGEAQLHFGLGDWQLPVSLAIATLSMILLATQFMHLNKATKLTWLTALGSLLWLGIMFLFFFFDYWTRHWAAY